MADDYVAFLLDLWHHGQMVHKINKTDLHEQVQDELSNLEMTNEGRTKLTKALRKIQNLEEDNKASEVIKLKTQTDNIRKEKERLLDNYR